MPCVYAAYRRRTFLLTLGSIVIIHILRIRTYEHSSVYYLLYIARSTILVL
jgi:hypothetical protein